MTLSDSVKRILIVGSGPAGWMAAIRLNRLLHALGATVSVVESVKLGTSDVADNSGPSLVQFVRTLGVDEFEFMQQCSATYQLGTRADGWMRAAEPTWQPFGLCGGEINNLDVFHFWLKSVRAGRAEGPYWSYSLQALLAAADKAPRPLRGPSPIVERGEYGYHLDPAGLADFCRERATAEGVNQLFDDVRNVVVNPEGGVERIETKSGRALTADLYIDCTADGEIIERGLGDPWVSWSAQLPCDRMVVLPLARDPEMPPYTTATALPAGWMQRAPLSHRVGAAHCYASAHLTDEAATRALLAGATPRRASAAEPRYLSLRTGRRQTFWRQNCVALGPAAGVIEPLAPIRYLLIVRLLELLVELFPDRTQSEPLRRAYNERAAALGDAVRDFTLLHYVLSDRDDTPFWRDVRTAALPDALAQRIALHDENGTVPRDATEAFPEPSYHHLFAGAQRLPRRPTLAADALDFDKVCDILGKMKAQNDEWMQRLPPHRELIERIHRPPV